MIWTILGGVGLFLLGMSLLTEGLKAAAGSTLRVILERRVSSPKSGVLWGAVLTALVQSSSATTMATIGFVSAGLLTFPQAVGVVFGANIGTTSTGWLVSLLGFKVSIGAIALPLIFVAALMRLFGRGRAVHYGLAIGGFGLLFVGLATLQGGMAGLAERVSPADLPQPTVIGRFMLVGLGLAMTIVMQSSSAAVATTLTALHAGAIEIDQAAALVIGQNIGSAVTSAIAAVGGSTSAKRTAVAHMMFNVVAAAVAVIGLAVFTQGAEWIKSRAGSNGDSIAIAAFHSAFNLLGVAILLPVIGRFSRLIERMVPERRSALLAHLDPRIIDSPMVAAEAARRTLLAVVSIAANASVPRLAGRAGSADRALHDAEDAIDATAEFLARAGGAIQQRADRSAHVSMLHAIDHLGRWIEALRAAPAAIEPRFESEPASLLRSNAATRLATVSRWASGQGQLDTAALAQLSAQAAGLRKDARASILERTATGLALPRQAEQWIDELKWFDRLMYHAWRATYHLQSPSETEPREIEAHEESGTDGSAA